MGGDAAQAGERPEHPGGGDSEREIRGPRRRRRGRRRAGRERDRHGDIEDGRQRGPGGRGDLGGQRAGGEQAGGRPPALYGRALVVIAAEQYALRLVLPASQRGYRPRWSSHKDLAAKALRKLAGAHVPVSLTKLEQAVKRAHDTHAAAERAHHDAQRSARRSAKQQPAGEPSGDSSDGDPVGEPVVDEELDELDADAL